MSRPRKLAKATSPPAEYEYHCFVSYTTRENEVVTMKRFIDRYLSELRGRGLRALPVFYDGFHLGDADYPVWVLHDHLERAIHSSAFVVSFVSPHYATSGWCVYEWSETMHEHKRRGSPAPDWSILPIVWKRDGHYSFGYPSRCRYLDISKDIAEERYGKALAKSVGVTIDYVKQWYPDYALPRRPPHWWEW